MALLCGRTRNLIRILQPHFLRNFRCISTGKLLLEEKVTHTGQVAIDIFVAEELSAADSF